jgi:hypothetical protein
VSGATITGNTALFTNVTGVSGVFTTQVSGATVTGTSGLFTNLTAGTGVFTLVSGFTVTGNVGAFTTVSGIDGVFTGNISSSSVTATTISATTGTFTSVTGTTVNAPTGIFTSVVSGATVTGNTGLFTVVTGATGVFSQVSGTTINANNFLGGTFSGEQYKVSGDLTIIDASGGVKPYGQFTFPASPGTNNYILTSNGDGTTMWRSTSFPSQGIILESIIEIIVNTAITNGNHGLSVGPVSVASGVVVTVPSGSYWRIV